MQALARFLDRVLGVTLIVSRWATYLGGGAILVSAFLISVDVLARRLLGLSTWGADELSNYALAISASWAFGYALLVKAHIRIDLVTTRLPDMGRAVLNFIALLAIGYLALGFAQSFFHIFMRSWSRGSTSITTLQTPLWIPQGLFLLGIGFFIFVTVLLMLRLLVAAFVERDFMTADRIAGAMTIKEETEDAMSDALRIYGRNG